MLTAFAAIALLAQSQSEPAVITNPAWLKRPGPYEFSTAIPPKIREEGGDVTVHVRCVVTEIGGLDGCVVISESQPGLGAAAAALSLTPYFQMRPPTVDGRPMQGTITIPIRFYVDEPFLLSPHRRLRVVSRPTWTDAPTIDQVRAAYPRGASGAAKIHFRCMLTGRMKPAGCELARTTDPRGKFLQAAKRLLPHFTYDASRLKKDQRSKTRVIVTITFVDPLVDSVAPDAVHNPTWLVGPDPKAISDALRAGSRGRAEQPARGVARCLIGAGGLLSECTPDQGQSPDPEMATPAASIANGLRVRPWTDDGRPLIGATVRIPVEFGAH